MCKGCSVLDTPKPIHAYLDYKDEPQVDILFVIDSARWSSTGPELFEGISYDILKDVVEQIGITHSWTITAAVKCPNVYDKSFSTADSKICRSHLHNTILHYKPKLIIALGNLALKQLLKKSGIFNKRGQTFELELEGVTYPVVPTFHPYVFSKEPQNKPLFIQDITLAYNTHILKIKKEFDHKYTLLTTIEQVRTLTEALKDISDPIAVDLETEGLNFLTDKILTIAISYDESYCACIPVHHKEHEWTPEELEELFFLIQVILKNPNNWKVFQGGNFDLKMLLSEGVYVKNVMDTKIMAHLIQENEPKNLADLVKKHFPETIGAF